MLPSTSNRIEYGSGPTSPPDERRHGTEEEALNHARAVTRAAGSSFYWAMRMLPAPRRDAMFAIYAFCREVDDIADGDLPADEKRARLDDWRREIQAAYDGTPNTPTGQALFPAIQRYGMRIEDFLAVIDGMEMDSGSMGPAPAMAELETYCDRVAGAVGLLSLHAFGATGSRCRDFALKLGSALQLTNILRDLAQDAEMQRCYLPEELLDRHGIVTRDPGLILNHPDLPRVCCDLATIAQQRYDEARLILRECPRRALRPAVVMMNHYERIFRRIVKSGWRNPERRISLPPLEKLWVAVRYGLI